MDSSKQSPSSRGHIWVQFLFNKYSISPHLTAVTITSLKFSLHSNCNLDIYSVSTYLLSLFYQSSQGMVFHLIVNLQQSAVISANQCFREKSSYIYIYISLNCTQKRAAQDIKGHIIKVIHSLLFLLENHSVHQYKSSIAMSGLEAEPNMASFPHVLLYCVLCAIASSNACMARWHRRKSLTVDLLML